MKILIVSQIIQIVEAKSVEAAEDGQYEILSAENHPRFISLDSWVGSPPLPVDVDGAAAGVPAAGVSIASQA